MEEICSTNNYLPCRLRRCRFRMTESDVSIWTSSNFPPLPPALLNVFGRVVRIVGIVVVVVVVVTTRFKLIILSPESSMISFVSDWILVWSMWRKWLLDAFLTFFSDSSVSLDATIDVMLSFLSSIIVAFTSDDLSSFIKFSSSDLGKTLLTWEFLFKLLESAAALVSLKMILIRPSVILNVLQVCQY